MKKLLLLSMLIFSNSNIITSENGWKEIDGTIVVYKRPPYKERNAALCFIALSFIYYLALQSKENPGTRQVKMPSYILLSTITAYFSYQWYITRNMAQEHVITLTPEGFTLEQGDSYTWKQLRSMRPRHTTYGSDLTEYDKSITFVLSDNTKIKLETDDLGISNDELIKLIKRFTSVGEPSPWPPYKDFFSEEPKTRLQLLKKINNATDPGFCIPNLKNT